MIPNLPQDHHCPWRAWAEQLQARLDEVTAELAVLRAGLDEMCRKLYGPRSEKMPPVVRELRAGQKPDAQARKAKRQQNAERRQELAEVRIEHKVEADKQLCPCCGDVLMKPVGSGRTTTLYEYVPPRFERQVHVQQVLACPKCDAIVTAEGAPKVIDKTHYGPGLVAQAVVAKCADAIPLYRQAKQLRRLGIPMAPSSLGELFHRAAELTSPLAQRLLALIAARDIVQADETTLPVQDKGKTRRAYLWTFLADVDTDEGRKHLLGYRFSPSRSGQTPSEVLGDSRGTLVVDAYTGYNIVTTPERRERAGCLAHLRRELFDALSTAPAARHALDLIREIYRVEHDALAQNVARTEAHRQMRHERSGPLMEQLKAYLQAEKPQHLPKGPMGKAIRYGLNNWTALSRFVDNEHIPVDNNASENALRAAALGRKNFMFLGHDKAGENIAGLYSLVLTCEANGINPQAYLADVLLRVQTHPASRIDELLPHNWKPQTPLDASGGSPTRGDQSQHSFPRAEPHSRVEAHP